MMSNEELLQELKRAANRLSFLNAGEGACYNAEARSNAKANFDRLLAESKARGLEFDLSGYLL